MSNEYDPETHHCSMCKRPVPKWLTNEWIMLHVPEGATRMEDVAWALFHYPGEDGELKLL